MVMLFLLLELVAPFNQAQQVPSFTAEDLERQGRDLLRDNNPQQARSVLEKAVALAPGSVNAWTLLAAAYSQTNMEEEATRSYEKVVQLQPKATVALYNLGVLQLRRKRFNESVDYLSSYLQQKPDDLEAHLLLAHGLLELGRAAEGQQFIDRALDKSHDSADLHLKAGQLLFAHGLIKPALEPLHIVLNIVLKTDEGRTGQLGRQALDLLVQCYVALRELEKAQRLAESAVAEGVTSENALIALANILQLRGSDPAVLDLLERHKSKLTPSARYLFTLSFSYYNMGNFPQARNLLQKVLTIEPGLPQAQFLLGNCLASMGELKSAIQYYEAALNLAPDKFLFHFQLGLVLSKLGRKEEAEKYLTRSVELNPSHAPTRYELAQIYFGTSRLDLALRQLEQAIGIDPQFESSYYLLSRVYSRLGRARESATVLEQFQDLQRQQRERAQAAKQVGPDEK